MSDDLAKLHHLEKYAAFGLESQSFEIMQETWNAQKSVVLKYLKDSKRTPLLLRASAFKTMCNFKIALIARETSEEVQMKTVATVISFKGFLKAASDQEKATPAWARALSIVTTSLLSLSMYLCCSQGSQTKLDLLNQCLQLTELGALGFERSSGFCIDKAKILQALAKEMQLRGESGFIEFLEKALKECSQVQPSTEE